MINMNKLGEIQIISKQILEKYKSLLSISNIIAVSNDKYQEIINEIKELVRKEYDLVHSLSLIEVELSLETIKELGLIYIDESWVRVLDKILEYREVHKRNTITSGNLGIKSIPKDLEFSTYDIILSMVDIETIKKVKNKIYNLVVSCDSDRRFVQSLKEKLNNSKENLLFNGASSEVIALYYNINIDQIPNIDISKIKETLPANINIDSILNNSTQAYITKILDSLARNTFYNNPEDVFTYLTLITQIEVMINYMDRMVLDKIYRYGSQITNINNSNNMETAKKLIKRKIENNHREEE